MLFSRTDLLYNEIYHLRQLNVSTYEKIAQLNPNEQITIIRIGDKLDDKLEIDEEYRQRIKSCEKICIKPEFEMLHIIHEDEFDNFIKQKSKTKPCNYLKTIIKGYEKTYCFNYNYFNDMSDTEIKTLIKEYSKLRGRAHKKKTKNLGDILREKL